MTTTPRLLAADFADRLEALRAEAAEAGHTDIDHLVEMAVSIARRRVSIPFVPSPSAAAADQLPG